MFISTHGIISPCFLIFVISFLLAIKTTSVQANRCAAMSRYCVCSYQFMKVELRRIIENSSPSSVVNRLQSYKCQSYRAIPSVLTTTMHRQNSQSEQNNVGETSDNGNVYEFNVPDYSAEIPQAQNSASPGKDMYQDKLLYSRHDPRHVHRAHFGTAKRKGSTNPNYRPRKRRKRRQIARSVMENQRIKLEKVVPQLPSTSSSHHTYAFLGHGAQLNCDMGPDKMQFYPNPQFEWIHSNGNPVSAPAVSINGMNGELTIPSAQLSDIDVYNCSVSSGPNIAFSSSRQLSVVTDSIHWLSVTAYYVTRTCSVRDMNTIQNSLPEWIADYICPVCTVHDSSIFCDTTSGGEDGLDSNEYQIKFAVTAFNLQNEILGGAISPQLCTEMCSQALQLSLLTTVRESVKKLLALPRHYSLKGESECIACSHGFYQSSPGASRCLPCGEGEDTIEAGSASPHSCLSEKAVAAYHSANKHAAIAVIFIILFLILLVILAVLFCICCCCPQSKLGKSIRSFCCFFCNLCAKTNPNTTLDRSKETEPIKKEDNHKSQRKFSASSSKVKILETEGRKSSPMKTTDATKSPVKNKTPQSSVKYVKLQLESTEGETSATSTTTPTEGSETESESRTVRIEEQPRKHSSNNKVEKKFGPNPKLHHYSKERWKSAVRKIQKDTRNKHAFTKRHSPVPYAEPTSRHPTEKGHRGSKLNTETVAFRKHSRSEPLPLALPSQYSKNETHHNHNFSASVRDTVAKMNAVSKFSRIQGNAPQRKMNTFPSHNPQTPHYSPAYENQRCEREVSIRRKPGAKDGTGGWKARSPGMQEDSAVASEEEELYGYRNAVGDNQWDHYCHRCIKPSQKQPRYYPPPPPPVPPK